MTGIDGATLGQRKSALGDVGQRPCPLATCASKTGGNAGGDVGQRGDTHLYILRIYGDAAAFGTAVVVAPLPSPRPCVRWQPVPPSTGGLRGA